MCQHRLTAYLLGLEAEGALFDDGACQHLVALSLGDRYWFAGDHRLVDEGSGLAQYASIDGDALAWAYLDGVARL